MTETAPPQSGNVPMDCPLMGKYPPGMDPVATITPALQIIGQRLEHLAGRVDEAIDGQIEIRASQAEMRSDVKDIRNRVGDLEERERERNGSIKDLMNWRESLEQHYRDKQTAQDAKDQLKKKYIGGARSVFNHDLFRWAVIGVLWLIGLEAALEFARDAWGL